MRRGKEQIMAEWAIEERGIGYDRRDWRGGGRFAWLCVVLLFAGLAADLLLRSSLVATICWIGAGASLANLLVRFYDPRFSIDRHPRFLDREPTETARQSR